MMRLWTRTRTMPDASRSRAHGQVSQPGVVASQFEPTRQPAAHVSVAHPGSTAPPAPLPPCAVQPVVVHLQAIAQSTVPQDVGSQPIAQAPVVQITCSQVTWPLAWPWQVIVLSGADATTDGQEALQSTAQLSVAPHTMLALQEPLAHAMVQLAALAPQVTWLQDPLAQWMSQASAPQATSLQAPALHSIRQSDVLDGQPMGLAHEPGPAQVMWQASPGGHSGRH